jgi:hypothetical protein
MLYDWSCDYGLQVCATANVPGAFPAVCNVWTIDFAALVLAGLLAREAHALIFAPPLVRRAFVGKRWTAILL